MDCPPGTGDGVFEGIFFLAEVAAGNFGVAVPEEGAAAAAAAAAPPFPFFFPVPVPFAPAAAAAAGPTPPPPPPAPALAPAVTGLRGVPQGESSGSRSVQILSKFSTESCALSVGTNGLGTSELSSALQSSGAKNGCAMTSSLPPGPKPSLLCGSLCSRALSSDEASGLR